MHSINFQASTPPQSDVSGFCPTLPCRCFLPSYCSRLPAAYGQVVGKGGKVKRVLANRQSAQRSRIRKLQHISELEATLEALQDDIFKLNPQLTKLEAKQAGMPCTFPLAVMQARQLSMLGAVHLYGFPVVGKSHNRSTKPISQASHL